MHNLDGIEDNDINIEGTSDYKLPQPDRETEMHDSSDEEDDGEVNRMQGASRQQRE